MNAYKLIAAVLVFAGPSLAQIPLFNYQGKLIDTNGVPVNGSVDVVLNVHTQEVLGTSVFTQNVGSVVVQGGLYSFHWGGSEARTAILNHPELWLEVSLDGSPLLPRQRIAAVPYALAAETARQAQSFSMVREFEVAPGNTVTQGHPVFLNLTNQLIESFSRPSQVLPPSPVPVNPIVEFNSRRNEFDFDRLDDQRFVVCYRGGDLQSRGGAVVGSLNGGTISLGAESFFSTTNLVSNYTEGPQVAALNPSKIAVLYEVPDPQDEWGGLVYTVVGNVTGSTISWGTPAELSSTLNLYGVTIAALSSNKLLLALPDENVMRVGTVQGTDITWGVDQGLPASAYDYLHIARLSTNKVVISFHDWNSESSHVHVGEFSGDTVTWGNNAPPNINYYSHDFFALNTNTVVLLENDGFVDVGVVSGTGIIWAGPESLGGYFGSGASGSALNDTQFVLANGDGPFLRVASFTGGTIQWVSEGFYITGGEGIGDPSCLQMNGGLAIFFPEYSLLPSGRVLALRESDVFSLPEEPFKRFLISAQIGIALETASGGSACPVVVRGTAPAYSNLTPGSFYWLDASGNLTRVPAEGVTLLGLAVSETEILLE